MREITPLNFGEEKNQGPVTISRLFHDTALDSNFFITDPDPDATLNTTDCEEKSLCFELCCKVYLQLKNFEFPDFGRIVC